MELCTSTRCILNRLPNLTSNGDFPPYRTSLKWRRSLPLKLDSISRNYPGSRYYNYSCIKALSSEEASNQYVKEEANYSSIKATTPEETNQYVKEESDGEAIDQSEDEKNGFGGFSLFKDDDTIADDQFPQFDFLNKLKVELDFEDSFSIALLSVGGIAALWLTTSIVGAIDNIPLFPKLMEVVGLGYTIWFSTRYLLFKRNRDELASKIEEIKQQVVGPKVDM